MRYLIALIFTVHLSFLTVVTYPQQCISSSFVLQNKRDALDRQLREKTIRETFSMELNFETEYRFESAFWAITQFMIYDIYVEKGFQKALDGYDLLNDDTRRSFLEALFTINPGKFSLPVEQLLIREHNPKIFAMGILFVYRKRPAPETKTELLNLLSQRFPEFRQNDVLLELEKFLLNTSTWKNNGLPPLSDLFAYQLTHQSKMVYSFQRKNRDYPGLAVLQNANGKFLRDSAGKLIVIRQLARSASNLPYFLTNGNTPQGIYSIQGLGTSHNNFIGPTPNIQMIMPHELFWNKFFHSPVDTTEPRYAYQQLLPDSWKGFEPVMESFYAGRIGRSEIIAHGTTIDPVYFAGKPYFPISPTLGCLCARELWNPSTGKLTDSEQLRLVNAFMATSGNKGYFVVLNLDDKQSPVTRDELEKQVMQFEKITMKGE